MQLSHNWRYRRLRPRLCDCRAVPGGVDGGRGRRGITAVKARGPRRGDIGRGWLRQTVVDVGAVAVGAVGTVASASTQQVGHAQRGRQPGADEQLLVEPHTASAADGAVGVPTVDVPAIVIGDVAGAGVGGRAAGRRRGVVG